MAVLYVVEQGAVVSKKGEVIVVSKDYETLTTVPAFAVEQVILFGRVQLTAPARDFLLEREIDTVLMSRTGRFRGRLTSYSGGNIELRQRQFRCAEQEPFLLDLAKRFVSGKLANCRAVLRRHQRRLQSPDVERGLIRLRKSLSLLEQGQTLDEVRGYEGDGSAAYFGCLGHLLKHPGFEFTRRTRRPPLDPFNALLSFGYTMLLGTVMTAVQVVGLEPYLGALHTPARGRPSIGLDLMEEFRPILVDAVAVRAVNRRQFVPEEFEYRNDALPVGPVEDGEVLDSSAYPVLLGRLGIKKWIALYEEQLQSRIDYPRFGCSLSFSQIVTEQARLLARHFLGEEPYQPFVVR
jgi:CRISPR-associated protein Cas1